MTIQSPTQNPARNYILISVPDDLADEVTAQMEERRAGQPADDRDAFAFNFGRWARRELRRGLSKLKQPPMVQAAPDVEAAPSPAADEPKTDELTATVPAPRSLWPVAEQDQEEDLDQGTEDQDQEDLDAPPVPKPAPPTSAGTEIFEGQDPVGPHDSRGLRPQQDAPAGPR